MGADMTEGSTETVILNSRLIESASWNAVTGLLSVRLRDGRERSFSAPRSMYENLVTAESPGWYYTRHIRPMRD